MSILDYVQAFEKSDIGQFFVTVDSSFVVLFQLVHIFGFLLLLTAVILLLLQTFGALPLDDGKQLVHWLLRSILVGLILASISGIALFATSASHYFTNGAMPVKMILLAASALLSWLFLKKWLVHSDTITLQGKVATIVLVSLWFATGFAGRAIGFV